MILRQLRKSRTAMNMNQRSNSTPIVPGSASDIARKSVDEGIPPYQGAQMLDGFNEGWSDFKGKEVGSRKGRMSLETVLRTLIERESAIEALSRATRGSRTVLAVTKPLQPVL